jgi:hypothetical protein
MWQHAPLAACFKQIEDAIKDFSQGVFSLAFVP